MKKYIQGSNWPSVTSWQKVSSVKSWNTKELTQWQNIPQNTQQNDTPYHYTPHTHLSQSYYGAIVFLKKIVYYHEHCKAYYKQYKLFNQCVTGKNTSYLYISNKQIKYIANYDQRTWRNVCHGHDSTPNPGNNFKIPLTIFQFNGSSWKLCSLGSRNLFYIRNWSCIFCQKINSRK